MRVGFKEKESDTNALSTREKKFRVLPRKSTLRSAYKRQNFTARESVRRARFFLSRASLSALLLLLLRSFSLSLCFFERGECIKRGLSLFFFFLLIEERVRSLRDRRTTEEEQ